MLTLVAGCQGGADSLFPKAERPLPIKLVKAMKAKGMTTRSPILIRIFKEDSALEVWKKKANGRFALLETYEICKWSGKLGPKFKEGDRQAPEGFYTVSPAQMNPKSSYHLSFNMGYPNTFDRAHGRTGSHLMVHGACSSAGCYSMTDELVEEIYSLARESFKGGQRKFQIQAFPFRMTAQNMVRHEDSQHYAFWKTLKEGSDHFEITKLPPKIDVCERNYVFNRQVEDGIRFRSNASCPQSTISASLERAYQKRSQSDAQEIIDIKEKQAKKQRLSSLLNGEKSEKPTPEPDIAEVVGTVEASAQTPVQQITTPAIADPAAPTPAANIPEPRPVVDGEEAPVVEKKRRGLFGWKKRS